MGKAAGHDETGQPAMAAPFSWTDSAVWFVPRGQLVMAGG
jgi:hypothetical protein